MFDPILDVRMVRKSFVIFWPLLGYENRRWNSVFMWSRENHETVFRSILLVVSYLKEFERWYTKIVFIRSFLPLKI